MYIIIRGPLGSGKTTISRMLAEKLNAKHIEMDRVLSENGLDTIHMDAPYIPVENFMKANELILPEVKKLLDQDKTVIFDACFYHKEVIEHLIKFLPYENFIFTLKVPLSVCMQRDMERDKTHGEDAAKAVYSLVTQFDYGTTINAESSIGNTVEQILQKLCYTKNET